MSNKDDIREFLMTRRARLTPEAAGLPLFGGIRRVTGLRREEVALLAGMSTAYYIRLERGDATGISESILEGLSRALQLDNAERLHLHELVRTANERGGARRKRRPVSARKVSDAVRQTIDSMTNVPVIVQNGRFDVLAMNRLGSALFSEMSGDEGRPTNFARYVFLDPTAADFYRDWFDSAEQIVALLRGEAGRAPYDRALTDLVGELSTRSDEFRQMWAAHDVRVHETGIKQIHHPVVGDLDLTYEAFGVNSAPGLMLIAFTAAVGTPSHDGLQLLASWAAESVDDASGMHKK
ncbi:XRE family transcriptional regulator [Rhodococcus sp. Leaf7]|uniref:helix-turn-helix domain-containing protein n=1 Tax=unclassified Rhodococcus (in: high G+C Gram-positive bacteria) TaxID=192944 RepID=UPI000700A995|nr:MULTISPECIES: helix-turn-helix transcriptional regulator [unclassified Rhodococcus (in: high G+C Gram-positive bacteria)]KQU02381.1 XRE family transcriptional regulator [Rhodococcus sp. Leaf7]KQU37853.1 XRE family transcriptional regulator [Rhodococcus sp. Leaf247]